MCALAHVGSSSKMQIDTRCYSKKCAPLVTITNVKGEGWGEGVHIK